SAAATTSASAPIWPASSCAWPSRSSTPASPTTASPLAPSSSSPPASARPRTCRSSGTCERVTYKIVSVDDHLIEPPDLFEGRLPSSLQERAPRVVELERGRQAWEYEGNLYPNVGLNAVVGRPNA